MRKVKCVSWIQDDRNCCWSSQHGWHLISLRNSEKNRRKQTGVFLAIKIWFLSRSDENSAFRVRNLNRAFLFINSPYLPYLMSLSRLSLRSTVHSNIAKYLGRIRQSGAVSVALSDVHNGARWENNKKPADSRSNRRRESMGRREEKGKREERKIWRLRRLCERQKINSVGSEIRSAKSTFVYFYLVSSLSLSSFSLLSFLSPIFFCIASYIASRNATTCMRAVNTSILYFKLVN